MTNPTISLIKAAQDTTIHIRETLLNYEASQNEREKELFAVESLAQAVVPLFNRNCSPVIPRTSVADPFSTYASRYPLLKPFLQMLRPMNDTTANLFAKAHPGSKTLGAGNQKKFEKILVDENTSQPEPQPSQSELENLHRIHAAQAAAEEGRSIVQDAGDEEVIKIIKKVMTSLVPEGIDLFDANTSAENYALQCVQIYPFSAPFLFQIFPALMIQTLDIPLAIQNDPAQLGTQLGRLWESRTIPKETTSIKALFSKIDTLFTDTSNRKAAYSTLIQALLKFDGETLLRKHLASLDANSLIAVELAKIKAARQIPPFDILRYNFSDPDVRFEIFLIAVSHSKEAIGSLPKYRFPKDFYAYPLIEAYQQLSLGLRPISEISTLPLTFCNSQGWEDLAPVLTEILQIKDAYDQKSALIHLIHFLGYCAIEKVTGEEFAFISKVQFLDGFHRLSKKTRNVLTREFIAVLKEPSSRSKSPYHMAARILLSRLIIQGLPKQLASDILKHIKTENFADTKLTKLLLDFLSEWVDHPLKNSEMQCIGKFLAGILSNPDVPSLSGHLQILTPILSIFGKQGLIQAAKEDAELGSFFLKQLQIFLEMENTEKLIELYGSILDGSKPNKRLLSLFKKMSLLNVNDRRKMLPFVHTLVGLFNNPDEEKIELNSFLDSDILQMTKDIFNINGFARDKSRDDKHEFRDHESVSEVQGTAAFCEKIVKFAEETPAILAPEYLRGIKRLNPTSLALRWKTLGHVFNQKGKFVLPDGTYRSLEGGNETFFLTALRASFYEFALENEDRVSEATRNAIAETLSKAVWNDNISDQKIEKIHRLIHDPFNKTSVLVGSGCDWHSTQIIFRRINGKIHYFYCNRGDDCGNEPGIVVCRVEDESKITPAFLENLTARLNVTKKNYMSQAKMQEELNAVSVDYIPMKEQSVGNCVYTSLKAAIFTLLILEDLFKDSDTDMTFPLNSAQIEPAKKTYKVFNQFDAETVLLDFLLELEEITLDRLFSPKYKNYLRGLQSLATVITNWTSDAMEQDKDKKVSSDLMEKTNDVTKKFQKKLAELANMNFMTQNLGGSSFSPSFFGASGRF